MDEPTALERVWERHLQPQPQPKQGLSTARIVAAAIEVADADGIGAVSMSRVAASLGFTTMSLYRHVRSKEELVLLMQDAAVGPTPPELVAAQGWREGLVRWAWATLSVFRRHPWFLQAIPMMGAPATPNQLAWLEQGLRALAGTTLAEHEKMTTILLVDAHVLSDLLYSAAGDAQDGDAHYAATLYRMLDPERFPALLRAAKGGAFEDSADPAAVRDADFTFGLDRILDGVEQLMEQRAAEDRGPLPDDSGPGFRSPPEPR